MPPCKKELKIFRDYKSNEVALTVYCCQSEGHEGQHEWHLWTDGKNDVTRDMGVIKVIH